MCPRCHSSAYVLANAPQARTHVPFPQPHTFEALSTLSSFNVSVPLGSREIALVTIFMKWLTVPFIHPIFCDAVVSEAASLLTAVPMIFTPGKILALASSNFLCDLFLSTTLWSWHHRIRLETNAWKSASKWFRMWTAARVKKHIGRKKANQAVCTCTR